MDRRTFMGTAGVAGLACLGASDAEAAETRNCYELRAYAVETQEQRDGLEAFLEKALIPAYNRIGIAPVGVFVPAEELSPVRVLLPHPSMTSVAEATAALLADAEFLEAGADFLNAPAAAPAYQRIESALLLAFTGMPNIEEPTKVPGRVFQLRTYESPSVKTGQKKIEMFNTAEIAIFRKTGLTPVFFGEALIGAKMPNLTYMLGFDSMDEEKAAWKRFIADPDWLDLRARPEYADKEILCGITNLDLRPAACSQI